MNLIGVDIGSYSLKVVSLRKSRGSLTLDAAATMRVPEGEGGVRHVTPGLLSGFISSQKIRGRRAATAMQGKSLSFRHLYLPMMPSREMREAVRWEIRKESTIPPNELVTDFIPSVDGGKTGEKTVSVMAFSARRSEVDAMLALFKEAGLDLLVIEAVPSALLSAYGVNREWEEGANVAMLDVGESRSTLSILKNVKLAFTRDITMGGADLTDALSSGLQIGVPEAEGYKVLHGLEDFEGSNPRAGALMRSSIEALGAELQRSFNYYQAQFREGAVSKLFISGGGARLKGLAQYLGGLIGIPAFIDDPFRNIRIPDPSIAGELKEFAPCFTVACGLAARTGA